MTYSFYTEFLITLNPVKGSGKTSMEKNHELEVVAEIFLIRLDEYKVKARLNQEELAQAFNVTRPTMSLYQRGKQKPTLEMVARLAELSGVSVSDLLKTDREETVEEKRKRIFLQEIWEVFERYYEK